MNFWGELAVAIWRAGVSAVDSQQLVQQAIQVDERGLTIVGERHPWNHLGRLIVLGGGKASGGMAAGVEAALAPVWERIHLTGLVNVPADCVRPLRAIELHAGRPAGVNEPTAAGVAGVERMLQLAAQLQPDDVALVLISGGGSALLPAPIEGISLEDKQQVTRGLMHAGATIQELNTVRKPLSRIKGGGLASIFPAGRVYGLVISDVIGDPLDVIASGPMVPSTTTPADALEILSRLDPQSRFTSPAVWQALRNQCAATQRHHATNEASQPRARISHHILGSNRVAAQAAGIRAEELGFRVVETRTDQPGTVNTVADEMIEFIATRQAEQNQRWQHRPGSDPAGRPPIEPGPRGWCLITGGEPTVQLTPTNLPRRGGRNQEVIVRTAARLWNASWDKLAIVSGGTDGEDGPTDAAGGVWDESIQAAAIGAHLDPEPYLAINNTYPFLAAAGGLLQTGPTETNVMDLRVVLVGRERSSPVASVD